MELLISGAIIEGIFRGGGGDLCWFELVVCGCRSEHVIVVEAMSPSLSRGVFNCGLLSTEAGTLARALADGMITIAGKAGVGNLANYTMVPTLVLVAFTTAYTSFGYYSLY